MKWRVLVLILAAVLAIAAAVHVSYSKAQAEETADAEKTCPLLSSAEQKGCPKACCSEEGSPSSSAAQNQCPKPCCGTEDCPKKDCPLRGGPVKFVNEMDKVSYVIGTQIGRNFKTQGIDIQMELLMRGMADALADADFALTEAEQREVMSQFQTMMQTKQQEKGTEAAAAGKTFLQDNKAKEGVTTLPSGLQYKVVKEGTGATPTADDKVKTNYRGTLIDGTEFDSSYKRGQPATFAVKGVIKGWTEALQLMKEGAAWQLFVPAELAYGRQGNGPKIPPNSALIFDIELLEVVQ